MRVYCFISGLEFNISDCFDNKIVVRGIHPIFEADVKYLLSRSADWSNRRLKEHETKLLFLALLNSTGLVDWRVPAKPSMETVEKYMERLIRIISWHNDIRSPAFKMPMIAITEETYGNRTSSLRNIGNWIETWEDKRDEWKRRFDTMTMNARLERREAALSKMIASPYKREESYAWMIADWAMTAGRVPLDLREKWTEVFKKKGIEINQTDPPLIERMIGHFQANLDFDEKSIHSHKVMEYLRGLYRKAKYGFNLGLEYSEEELANLDYEALINTEFVIREDSVQEFNKQVAASEATIEEPQAKDYPYKWQYQRAMASWRLARGQAEKTLITAKLVKKETLEAERKELLDAINAREETEIAEDLTGLVVKGL